MPNQTKEQIKSILSVVMVCIMGYVSILLFEVMEAIIG